MRFKAQNIEIGDYDQSLCSAVSISKVIKLAFNRGVCSLPLNLVINFSETGGYTDFIRTISPLVLNPMFKKSVAITLTKLVRYPNGKYNISDLVFKFCKLSFVISRDKISEDAFELIKEIKEKHGARIILDTDDDLFSVQEAHCESELYKKRIELYKAIISRADVIVTSNRSVQESVIPYCNGRAKLAIIPNYIDSRIWPDSAIRISNDQNTVKVLYAGTETHDGDLAIIAPLITRINQQLASSYNKRIEIVVAGGSNIPLDNLTIVKVPESKRCYPEYVKWVRSLGPFSFAIAPLDLNNPLNHSKSPLKYLEYSIIGLPCIFTSILPYESTVHNQLTGVLIPNNNERLWEEALIDFATNETKAKEIAMNAYNDILENHMLQSHFNQWVQVIE